MASVSAIALHAPARRAGSKRRFSAWGVNGAHSPSAAGASFATESALHSANADPWAPACAPSTMNSAMNSAANSEALHEHVRTGERLARVGRLLRDSEKLGDADDRLLQVFSMRELLCFLDDCRDLGVAADRRRHGIGRQHLRLISIGDHR